MEARADEHMLEHVKALLNFMPLEASLLNRGKFFEIQPDGNQGLAFSWSLSIQITFLGFSAAAQVGGQAVSSIS